MLGLIAVVTGSRELYKSAEPSTVKRCLLLLRGLLGARLGFRRLLGFFRGHIQRLLSLGFSDARSKIIKGLTCCGRRDAIRVELDDPLVGEDAVDRGEAAKVIFKHFIEF